MSESCWSFSNSERVNAVKLGYTSRVKSFEWKPSLHVGAAGQPPQPWAYDEDDAKTFRVRVCQGREVGPYWVGPYGSLPASDKTRSVGAGARIARSRSGVMRNSRRARASRCSGDIVGLMFSRRLM